MFRPPTPIVKNLLIINVGIALAQMIVGIDLGSFMGLHYIFSEEFLPFQFFTYMFLHSTDSIMHLLGNMLMLFFFGPMLEEFLGPKKFLTLFIVAGLGAGVIYTGVNYLEASAAIDDINMYINNPNPEDFNRLMITHGEGFYSQVNDFIDSYARNPSELRFTEQSIVFANQLAGFVGNYNMVGASGAVIGVLVAFALFFPNTEMRLLFPPVAVKAKFIAGALVAYDLFAELQRAPDGVAHWAHLGGAFIAWVLVTQWKKNKSDFY